MGNYLYPTKVDVNPLPLSKLIVVLNYFKIYVQSNDNDNNNLLIPEEIAQIIALFLHKIKGIIEPETELVFEEKRRYYYIARYQPLRINKYIKLSQWEPNNDIGGVIQIYCNNKLIIQKNGCIDANGCGYYYKCGRGKGKTRWYEHDMDGGWYYTGGGCHATKGSDYGKGYYNDWVVKGGIKYGDKYLNTLSFGSPSGSLYEDREFGGGGIIELIAPIIINYGSILSSGCANGYGGSGGSIKMKTKTFINKGIISANGAESEQTSRGYNTHHIAGGGAGYITIYCEEYENYGNIEPTPHIEYENYYQKNKIIKFSKINHEYKR